MHWLYKNVFDYTCFAPAAYPGLKWDIAIDKKRVEELRSRKFSFHNILSLFNACGSRQIGENKCM